MELDLETADELPTGTVPARKLRNESAAPLFRFRTKRALCVIDASSSRLYIAYLSRFEHEAELGLQLLL